MTLRLGSPSRMANINFVCIARHGSIFTVRRYPLALLGESRGEPSGDCVRFM